MPLFGIENHLSLDARDRYASTYLEKLACIDEKTLENNRQFRLRRGNQRWEALREKRTNKILEMNFEDTDDNQEGEEEDDPALYLSQRGVKGNPISTLYALMHLFDAAARRRMPYNRAREGRLPVEIYSQIFKHTSDMATRESCTKPSRTFRQLCQEDLLLAEGIIFKPCEAVQSCVEPHQVPEWFHSHDLTSDTLHRVGVRAGSSLWNSRPESEPEMSYMMAVGPAAIRRACSRASNSPSSDQIHHKENIGSTKSIRKYRCVELLEF